MSAAIFTPGPTLIDQLLQEQAQLTAVDRFARQHSHSDPSPAQERYYRALIPLGKPRHGEQYAFAVDLDACTGCKACVSACHSLNGLDEHETWRSTGLLHGGSVLEPYQQVVTTACHHCLDPACANGCPVLAYEKDPATGIVRHLDDQCIGCQYCVLKCPYDVPQYSAKRGIVRKCDLCHSRLSAGEAPACVQACPSAAISIQIASQAATAERCSVVDQQLLPGTAPSAYTQPTTVYSSRRPFPLNVQPADAERVRPQPAHWPLIWMLLLTQLAAGMTLMGGWLALLSSMTLPAQRVLALSAALALHAGLVSSLFHLGRPQGAWRAFLGWRRSWMSREILAFGAFATASVSWAVASFLAVPSAWIWMLNGAAGALGRLSVFCSAMIYVDTRRTFWMARNTFPRFFGATVLLGAAGTAAILSCLDCLAGTDTIQAAHLAAWLATGTRTPLFVWEMRNLRAGRPGFLPGNSSFRNRLERRHHLNAPSALLIWGHFPALVWTRVVLFIVSTICGLLALWEAGAAAAILAGLSFLTTFSCSVVERYFFFVAVIPPKMPGGAVS